ncbi:MAG: hypothetical protein JW809_16140 [Pirellulales bacterium]|nr:hypothetical protein [Pirellulales bacterium]
MSILSPPEQTVEAAAPSQPEVVVAERLRRTGRHVRGVETASGILALLIGAIGYLFLAALADHWLVAGGLGPLGRWLVLAVLCLAVGAYGWRFVVQPLFRRVNPVYVAQTIEQSGPSFKNSLINFLLLRRESRQVAPAVFEAVSRRAADDVVRISPEVAVDRGHVLRLGYVLVVLVLVGAIYQVASPKSPLRSAFRMVLPWADIAAPTRVTFEDVEPGDAVVFHGERIVVSAEVTGLGDDEPVLLFYTTADGQCVDQAIPMAVPEGKYRHECALPPDSFGMQQDAQYYLAAGDGRTPRFSITVQTAPTIDVESIHYDYPEYTGLTDRTAVGQGDVRAIEGTEITVRAKASRPIDWAQIDLGCNGLRGVPMTIEGDEAVGRFTLRLRADEPGRPEFDAYQIRFVDASGRENRRPVRYQIDVIPDVPPEVAFVDPPAEHVELPSNGRLEWTLEARDPDFALRGVALRAQSEGKSLPIPSLLDRTASDEPYRGTFRGKVPFEPAKLELSPGDRIVYWAEAKDNKTPLPGRSETQHRWITIAEPSRDPPPGEQPRDQGPSGKGESDRGDQPPSPDEPPGQPPPDPSRPPEENQQPNQQQDPANEQQEPGQEPGAGEGSQGNPDQQAEQQPGQQPPEPGEDAGGSPDANQPGQNTKDQDKNQQGQNQQASDAPGPNGQGQGQPKPGAAGQGQQGDSSPERPSEPLDGQANPGDVFEQVLKQREKAQSEQSTGQEQPGKPQSGQQQPAEQQSAPRQPGQPQPAPQQPDQTQQQSQPGSGQQPGQQQPDQQQQSARGEQPGEQDPDQRQQPGQPQPGQQGASAEDTAAEPGGQPAGENPTGQPQSGGDAAPSGNPAPRPDPTAGPGQQGNQEAGTPAAQKDARPGQKQPGQPQGQPGDERQPTSPSASPHDSNAQGDTSGDRSGGGEEGGGQRANQSGTGAAGRNTESEQGGSTGSQPGQGPTGDRPGDRVEADSPTGRSAEKQPGQGEGRPGDATAKDGEHADGPSQQPGESPGQGDPSGGPRQPGQAQPGPSESGQGGQGAQPGQQGPSLGGGRNTGQGQPDTGQEPGGDEFNKEFAQKQTDLALEFLKDQLAKEKPDQELLDALGGWTRDDLAEFTRRWQEMKQAAAGDDAQAARKQLDEALRSLGLQSRRSDLRSGTTNDAQRGMFGTRRIAPPPGWEDQIEAYRRGIGAGR